MQCTFCHSPLPQAAKFCPNCGQSQLSGLKSAPKLDFNWEGGLVAQANIRFRKRLEERVRSEQDESKMTAYQERIYESNYREVLQRRLEQWADKIHQPVANDKTNIYLKELKHLIDNLLDFFFIVHCADINIVVLNEAILRYQNVNDDQLDYKQMVMDFLYFEREEERIYTDFIELPVKKIKNAAKQFLFPEKEELIWFICDQSLLGNAKEGFAMTEKALYWKSGLQPAQCVYYHKIFSIQKEKEWLLINDLFFNATPSLNTKMIWLLRKLAKT